jgi:hypothetical protein
MREEGWNEVWEETDPDQGKGGEDRTEVKESASFLLMSEREASGPAPTIPCHYNYTGVLGVWYEWPHHCHRVMDREGGKRCMHCEVDGSSGYARSEIDVQPQTPSLRATTSSPSPLPLCYIQPISLD